MIKVDILKHKQRIETVHIHGHAMYHDEFDIVCASVSSIAITTVNAILRIHPKSIRYEKKDGDLLIKCLEENTINQQLLENMIQLFRSLEEQYPSHVKIKNEEV